MDLDKKVDAVVARPQAQLDGCGMPVVGRREKRLRPSSSGTGNIGPFVINFPLVDCSVHPRS
jgi:hypothetical protein